MRTEQLEFESMEQQQAVFGIQDNFVRIVEKAFSVFIRQRDTAVEIAGEDEEGVLMAKAVVISMQKLYNNDETLNEDAVYRLIDEAKEGNLDETFSAMSSSYSV